MAINVLFSETQLGALDNFKAEERKPKFFVSARAGQPMFYLFLL